jgi:hypothetical protein
MLGISVRSSAAAVAAALASLSWVPQGMAQESASKPLIDFSLEELSRLQVTSVSRRSYTAVDARYGWRISKALELSLHFCQSGVAQIAWNG